MKRGLVVFLVCTLMIGSVFVGASVNTKNFLFKTVDGVVVVNIPAGGYEVKKTDNGDELYVEDFGCLLIPGKPSLPSKIFSVAIPPGAQFKEIHFDTLGSVVLPGTYNVPSVSLPRVIGDENPVIYEQELKRYEENYRSTYGSNNPYPSSVVEFVQTSGYRKYNLVDVRFTPFTYYPLSGELVYHPNVKVYISYMLPRGSSAENVIVDDIDRAEKQAKNIVYNYDQAQSWYTTNEEGSRALYDYVIITLDSLTSSVSSLVDWETTKGRNVNVVTTSWINTNYNGYDLAEKIRNFLRDKYPSSQWGITDVCIIGHRDDIPMRRCWQDLGYGKPETDFYYAELTLPDSQSWDADGDHRWGENSDPIDFYGEVSVGRIPWSDPSIVAHICEKSVTYEQNNDPGFKKNILLLGAFFWDNDPNPRTDNAVLMEYKTNPSNNPWMSNWTRTRMYEQGYSTYTMDYDITYDNVKNIWSNGTYAFVDWAGHGSPTSCVRYHPSMTEFVNTDTCLHLNDNYPSIIFADACSNSDTDEYNIGQAMLKQGAVGFLGATKVALGMPGWNNPNSGSSQSFDYYFTSCVTSGEFTQGQAHQWSLTKMYTSNLWAYLKYETFEWGALWGNPDLTTAIFENHPPEAPEISGETNGQSGTTYIYSLITTDLDDDQVYYYVNWGDGTNSGWIGPYNSGEQKTTSHSWSEQGTYQVKAKARDTHGAESNWTTLDVVMPINHIVNHPIQLPLKYFATPIIKQTLKYN
ncbi:MAG: C25 family cysteine peptidase [Candidatus Thermoplasmatota archaeon]|jgi:hypothetical protein|nr:C25 family cysteine peptidase [Candidatus Thermoplasmatota archaeon]